MQRVFGALVIAFVRKSKLFLAARDTTHKLRMNPQDGYRYIYVYIYFLFSRRKSGPSGRSALARRIKLSRAAKKHARMETLAWTATCRCKNRSRRWVGNIHLFDYCVNLNKETIFLHAIFLFYRLMHRPVFSRNCFKTKCKITKFNFHSEISG